MPACKSTWKNASNGTVQRKETTKPTEVQCCRVDNLSSSGRKSQLPETRCLPTTSFSSLLLSPSCRAFESCRSHNRNELPSDIKEISAVPLFRTPLSLFSPSYLASSEASQGSSSYEQTGYVSGLYLPARDAGIYHIND